jgi:hypothetical protein
VKYAAVGIVVEAVTSEKAVAVVLLVWAFMCVQMFLRTTMARLFSDDPPVAKG